MEKLFQALYSGLLYGSIYGLMAIGLTLIWGSLRLLNLAHGSLYLVGGYAAWTALNLLGLPVVVSFVIAIIIAGGAALLMQVSLLNPILGKPGWDNASMIVTVGISIVLSSAALLIYGPRVKQMPPLIAGSFKVGQVLISYQGLVIIVAAILSLILLNIFLRKTRYGLAIQAVSQQMDASQLMGIPTLTVFMIVMFISGALAGLGGVLLSSVFYLSPTSGFNPMIRALIVTIFGGLGSVKGTIWAALIIGLLESCLQVYLGPTWALPGLFVFMILMLVVRPSGLFGLGEMQRL